MPGIPSGNNVPNGGNVLSGGNIPSGNNIPASDGAVTPPGLAVLEFWHIATNADLLANTTLVDGQAMGTWKNAGVRGATGDVVQATAAAKPAFRLVASLGKLKNKSGMEAVNAARYMASGAFVTIPQPFQVAFVWSTSKTTTQIVDTGSGATPQIFTPAAGNLMVNAGGGAKDTGLVVSAGDFHMAVITINGASSVARVDGLPSFPFSPGAIGFASTLQLMGIGTLGIIGFLMEHLVWSVPQPDADIEAYLVAQWGAFPQ